MYHGDIRLGDTLDLKFTTRRFTTGAPFTLAGSPVISAYVGNSTTEITAGITLTVDFDSRTGLNNVRVVATSGNGYATASNVDLVITTGTVDSVSVVGEVVASFSIEARSALMAATAGRALDVTSGRSWNRLATWQCQLLQNNMRNTVMRSTPNGHQASIHRRQFRYIPAMSTRPIRIATSAVPKITHVRRITQQCRWLHLCRHWPAGNLRLGLYDATGAAGLPERAQQHESAEHRWLSLDGTFLRS